MNKILGKDIGNNIRLVDAVFNYDNSEYFTVEDGPAAVSCIVLCFDVLIKKYKVYWKTGKWDLYVATQSHIAVNAACWGNKVPRAVAKAFFGELPDDPFIEPK